MYALTCLKQEAASKTRWSDEIRCFVSGELMFERSVDDVGEDEDCDMEEEDDGK